MNIQRIKLKTFVALASVFTISFLGAIQKVVTHAAITNSREGGRLGDQLLNYLHAKYISFELDIPLFLQSFDYANQFAFYYLENHYDKKDIGKTVLLSKRSASIDVNKNVIYSMPYFSEVESESKAEGWYYVKIDWQQPQFKHLVRQMLDPINPSFLDIHLPKDRLTVAVHIRRGGGYDQPLFSDDPHAIPSSAYADFNAILKFPPLGYYIEQLKTLSTLVNNTPIYAYIFTDDKEPYAIVKKLQEALSSYTNITFDYRKQDNAYDKNVLEDLFALTKYDCLIRPQSSFSIVASKLADYKIEISPTRFYRKNKVPFIGSTEIRCNARVPLKHFLELYSRQTQNCTSKRLQDSADRQSSFPYISGDSFRAISDHIFDETDQTLNPKNVNDKDIIFLKTDYMSEFFSKIHPEIEHKYILITHNSDLGAPGNYERYLDDKKIIKWFGMNPTVSHHDKFTPIPIGIANQYWNHGNITTFHTLIEQSQTGNKHILLGINFEPSSNAKVRKPISDYFSKKEYCVNLRSPSHLAYLDNMRQSKFILSPEGNGIDCHRTWEALLMGAIPIAKSSNLDCIWQDLPVLVVPNWHEITEEYLNKKYQEFSQRTFNLEKIFFKYWAQLIESEKFDKLLGR